MADKKKLKPLKINSIEVKCPRPGCNGYFTVYPGKDRDLCCNGDGCDSEANVIIVVRSQNEWGVFYQNETWRVYETRWDCCSVAA